MHTHAHTHMHTCTHTRHGDLTVPRPLHFTALLHTFLDLHAHDIEEHCIYIYIYIYIYILKLCYSTTLLHTYTNTYKTEGRSWGRRRPGCERRPGVIPRLRHARVKRDPISKQKRPAPYFLFFFAAGASGCSWSVLQNKKMCSNSEKPDFHPGYADIAE